MPKCTYNIAHVGKSESFFKVTKFLDGQDQPSDQYFVTYGKVRNEMICDCPNRRRNKHINDKHGVMVAKWLLAGEPVGFYDDKGEWHGTEHLSRNPFEESLERDDGIREDGDISDDINGEEEHN